ncbi:hypothetical protein J3A83DRAFT_4373824 [Scleroderma citrinum]
MLPQPAQQLRSHNPAVSSAFITQNPSLDSNPYLNLDPDAAAKQMAALNATNLQRQFNARQPPPSHMPVGGTSTPSFLSGMAPSHNQHNSLHQAPNDTSHNMSFNPAAQLSVHPNMQPSSYPTHSNANVQSAASSLDPTVRSNMVSRQTPNAATMKQQPRSLLYNLATLHNSRGTPLPPGLTGCPYPPNYDPTNSCWKNIECVPGEIGVFRLGGKDIELAKLWSIIWRAGGSAKVTQQSAWPLITRHFDLPDILPGQFSTNQSTADTLARYYNLILQPFEEFCRQNFPEKMMTTGRPVGTGVAAGEPNNTSNIGHPPGTVVPGVVSQVGAAAGVNNMANLMNQPVLGHQNPTTSPPALPSRSLPQSPHPRQITPGSNISGSFGLPESLSSGSLSQSLSGGSVGQATANVAHDQHDQDIPPVKRKLEAEETDGKRAKLKTGGSNVPDSLPLATSSVDRPSQSIPSAPSTSSGPPPRPQSMRAKIEYIPLAREVDTCGGRDFNLLEEEYQRAQRRPLRDINEWGTVDIEALTMSIRSRLTVELSYALTTLTLLSTMKGPTPGSGFPIAQCTDLLEEVLDLLEDEAFDGIADAQQHLTKDTHIPRHRELVAMVHDNESLPFSGLKDGQILNKKNQGPWHRPGHIVLTVTNIIRNLSVVPDNVQFLAKHQRMLGLVLRISSVVVPHGGGPPRAASPCLTLPEVLQVRKDIIHILSNVASMVTFPSTSPCPDSTVQTVTRIFELTASVLVEPVDAISPMQMLKLSGVPFPNCLPPSLPDVTLDVFTRIAHLDQNRQVFSKVVPQEWIWRLLETLVHRLPVSDADFSFLAREPWLSYLEKTTMAIYVIAFMSPPELKKRIKSDKSLRFSQVMIRMVQRFLTTSSAPEARTWFMVTARRAIEAMKVVDDGEDAFDTSHSAQPTLAFGMGFGETGEMIVEKGTGMLAGRRDVAWELLMQRDLDPVLFAELESLTRVE